MTGLRRLPFALALCVLAACAGDKDEVLVDLKTDLVPGREFHTVRTERMPGAVGADGPSAATVTVTRDDDFARGRRVAELPGPPGRVDVRVTLLDTAGATVAERLVTATVRGATVVTVIVSRSCTGVVCPPPEDPMATTCVGAHCVHPDCTPENPSACAIPLCTRDADCAPRVPCAEPICASGVCFSAPVDALCAAGERCDPARGCVSSVACGDGTCSPGETTCSCPVDCGAHCGDGCCNGEETTSGCPGDCGGSCGDSACNAGETTCGCSQDCGSSCGDGCCTTGESCTVCQGDCGGWNCECQIRCCDGFLMDLPTNSDAECAGYPAATGICDGRLSTLRIRRGDNLLYDRGDCPVCCAQCRNRTGAYQMVGVTMDCTAAASGWCAQGTRGGLHDAFWGSCPLPP